MSQLGTKSLWCYRTMMTSYALLLLIYTVNSLFLVVDETPISVRIVVWLLHIVPLLMVLPGLLRQNLRAPIWLCFLLQLYFILVVLQLFTPGRQLLEWVIATVVVTLFISAMMCVRWRARYLRELEDE